MKHKARKSWSALLAMVLAISTFPYASLAMEVEGETFVYKADFNSSEPTGEVIGQDIPIDPRFPAYEMNYSGKDHTKNWVLPSDHTGYPYVPGAEAEDSYSLEYGVFGKEETDGALKMKAEVKEAKDHSMTFKLPSDMMGIPTVSGDYNSFEGVPCTRSLENATDGLQSGQQMRLSFEIAKNDTAENFSTMLTFRGGSGSLRDVTIFSMDTDKNMLFASQNVGSYELGRWYQIDIIFTQGAGSVDCYVDGQLVLAAQKIHDDTFLKLNKIFMQVRQSNNSAPAEVYLDNYQLSILPVGTVVKAESIREDFSMFTGYPEKSSYKWFSYFNMNNGNGYRVEKSNGVFGKTAGDSSAKMVIVPAGDGQNQGNPFISGNTGGFLQGWEYGDKVRMGVKLAFDNPDFYTQYFYLTMRAISGTTNSGAGDDGLSDGIIVDKDGIKFGGALGKQTKEINWAPKKWYTLEWIIEPGNGVDVRNKLSVYLDSEYLGTVEFDALKGEGSEYSQINGVHNLRFALQARGEAVIPGKENSKPGFNVYIDDYFYEKMEENAAINAVTVTASEDIGTDYKNVLFIQNDETVGEMKAKVSVSGGTSRYVDAVGNPLEDAAPAKDSYLEIKSEDGEIYYYGVFDKIVWYEEDFESYTIIENQPYQYMQLIPSADAVASGKQNLAGKSGQAYSFSYDRQELGNGDGAVLNFNRSGADTLPLSGASTLEFSLYVDAETSNALRAGLAAQWTYEYDDNGTPASKIHGINDLISAFDGKLYAGSYNNSESRTYLCEIENGQWYKFAFVIDPEGFDMDVYVNGEKKAENVNLAEEDTAKNGAVITGLTRLKLAGYYSAANAPHKGQYAFDDIAFYAGEYDDAAKDAAGIDSVVYDMNHEGYIVVDSNTDDLEKTAFLNNIALDDGIKSIMLYDDDTFTGNEEIENNGVFHGNMLVAETETGALHYYRIVDKAMDTDLAASPALLLNGVAVPSGAQPDLGQYTLRTQIEKYNENEETYCLILAIYTDGRLQSIGQKNVALEFGKNTIEVQAELEEMGAQSTQIKAFAWNDIGGGNPYTEPVIWSSAQ